MLLPVRIIVSSNLNQDGVGGFLSLFLFCK